MTVSQETLTIQNAPRDAAQLAAKGAYKLRKLATDLGLLNNPEHKSAFINGKPDEMAQVVVAGLRAFDTQQPSNGVAAPANGVAPVALATPPMSVMGGMTAPPAINIPGATGAAPAPAAEAPATGRGKRSPQPASDGGELVAAIKALQNSVETNSQAVATLAKPVLDGKASSDLSANNSAAVYQLLQSMQRTQNLTLSLLMMLAESVLQDGQGALLEAAQDSIQNFPQVFGAQAAAPGKA